jgi:hypothetical protein
MKYFGFYFHLASYSNSTFDSSLQNVTEKENLRLRCSGKFLKIAKLLNEFKTELERILGCKSAAQTGAIDKKRTEFSS